MQQANEWGHKDKCDFSRVKTSWESEESTPGVRPSKHGIFQNSLRKKKKKGKNTDLQRPQTTRPGRGWWDRVVVGRKDEGLQELWLMRMLHKKKQEAEQKPHLFWDICRQTSDLKLVICGWSEKKKRGGAGGGTVSCLLVFNGCGFDQNLKRKATVRLQASSGPTFTHTFNVCSTILLSPPRLGHRWGNLQRHFYKFYFFSPVSFRLEFEMFCQTFASTFTHFTVVCVPQKTNASTNLPNPSHPFLELKKGVHGTI